MRDTRYVADVNDADALVIKSKKSLSDFFLSLFPISMWVKLRSKGNKSRVGPVKANHFKFSYTHCFAWIQNLEASVAYSKV